MKKPGGAQKHRRVNSSADQLLLQTLVFRNRITVSGIAECRTKPHRCGIHDRGIRVVVHIVNFEVCC